MRDANAQSCQYLFERSESELLDHLTRFIHTLGAAEMIAFRATVAAALAELHADCEQQVRLIGGINDDYAEGVKFALKSLNATITKLGLEEQ